MRIIVSILIIAICLYGLGLGVYTLFFYQQEYGEMNLHFTESNLDEFIIMPYETMEGFMIAMASVGIAVLTSIVLLKTTDLIYPLEIYRLKLVSKNIQLVAGHTSGLKRLQIKAFRDKLKEGLYEALYHTGSNLAIRRTVGVVFCDSAC